MMTETMSEHIQTSVGIRIEGIMQRKRKSRIARKDTDLYAQHGKQRKKRSLSKKGEAFGKSKLQIYHSNDIPLRLYGSSHADIRDTLWSVGGAYHRTSVVIRHSDVNAVNSATAQ